MVPSCTVERSSPTSVYVKVESESPYVLMLNQAFGHGWRAYEGSPNWLQVLAGSGRLPAGHFMADGYANGWYIDRPGEYELTLYYWPQTLLYVGVII